MTIKEVKEYADVFEAGVHTLAVEGYHCVSGIAEDDNGRIVVIGRALNGDEREMRVIPELLLQVLRGNEVGTDAGKVLLEERQKVCLWGCGERCEVGRRGEESAGERFVERGDSDEHERAAGPDVQMVGGDREGGASRRDMELAPESVDVFLLVGEAGVFHHVIAGSRVGTIGADEEIEVYRYLGGSFLLSLCRAVLGWVLGVIDPRSLAMPFKPSGLLLEISSGELVVEM